MMKNAWALLKQTGVEFVADNALSRGAAIAYYTIFSIGPVLLIVVAMMGLFLGRQAAQGDVVGQLSGLMGQQGADAIQTMIVSADRTGATTWATAIGVVTLLITASGVFSEMQSSLNAIWKAEPSAHGTVTRLIRARAISLGLVMGLGFLLLVSFILSAGISALSYYIEAALPGGHLLFAALNIAVSFLLEATMFAAIYKVLPDNRVAWRDVGIGAAATAALFTLGKVLIGLYIGRSAAASSYGAAGALIIVLLWIYYSAQIFLFGAEFTKVYAQTFGSMCGSDGVRDARMSSHPKIDELRDRLADAAPR
jgi:membrane protein